MLSVLIVTTVYQHLLLLVSGEYWLVQNWRGFSLFPVCRTAFPLEFYFPSNELLGFMCFDIVVIRLYPRLCLYHFKTLTSSFFNHSLVNDLCAWRLLCFLIIYVFMAPRRWLIPLVKESHRANKTWNPGPRPAWGSYFSFACFLSIEFTFKIAKPIVWLSLSNIFCTMFKHTNFKKNMFVSI